MLNLYIRDKTEKNIKNSKNAIFKHTLYTSYIFHTIQKYDTCLRTTLNTPNSLDEKHLNNQNDKLEHAIIMH